MSQSYTSFESYLGLNKNIEELKMNNCKLGRDGCKSIGMGLKKNSSLIRVSLSANLIEDDGVEHIIKAIMDNRESRLQEIDLSSNKIAFNSTNFFCTFLKRSKTCHSISLRDNLIRE